MSAGWFIAGLVAVCAVGWFGVLALALMVGGRR